jgi:hypothetical protein
MVIGSEVYGANNPDKKGLFATTFVSNKDTSSFTLQINNDVLKFNGKLSTGNENKYDWKIETNTDRILVASLLTPEEENNYRKEFYNLFIDKKMGQGIISSSKEFQYSNINLTGFVSYLTCQVK